MEGPSLIQQIIWRYPFFEDPGTQLLVNVLIVTFLVFFAVVWIYSLADCLRSDFQGSSDKVAWILVLVFLPILGTPMYIGIAKSRKKHRTPIARNGKPRECHAEAKH